VEQSWRYHVDFARAARDAPREGAGREAGPHHVARPRAVIVQPPRRWRAPRRHDTLANGPSGRDH
jgi:hypothetical protein